MTPTEQEVKALESANWDWKQVYDRADFPGCAKTHTAYNKSGTAVHVDFNPGDLKDSVLYQLIALLTWSKDRLLADKYPSEYLSEIKAFDELIRCFPND